MTLQNKIFTILVFGIFLFTSCESNSLQEVKVGPKTKTEQQNSASAEADLDEDIQYQKLSQIADEILVTLKACLTDADNNLNKEKITAKYANKLRSLRAKQIALYSAEFKAKMMKNKKLHYYDALKIKNDEILKLYDQLVSHDLDFNSKRKEVEK